MSDRKIMLEVATSVKKAANEQTDFQITYKGMEATMNNQTCNTCGRAASNPYRRLDAEGRNTQDPLDLMVETILDVALEERRDEAAITIRDLIYKHARTSGTSLSG